MYKKRKNCVKIQNISCNSRIFMVRYRQIKDTVNERADDDVSSSS